MGDPWANLPGVPHNQPAGGQQPHPVAGTPDQSTPKAACDTKRENPAQISENPGAAQVDGEAVLLRLRAGDRAAAADFILRYGPLIRRRVRGRLSPAARRVYDSQEILSTVARRFDAFVAGHRLEASDEAAVVSLVLRMAETAVLDKVKVMQRIRRLESEDRPFVQSLQRRMERADEQATDGATVELARVFELASSAADRELLALRLHGLSHDAIAWMLGETTAAVRQRWHRLRDELRTQWEQGATP